MYAWGEGLGNILVLVDVLMLGPPLRDEGTDDERGFGQSQGVDILELSQDEDGAGLLVAGGARLRARGPGVMRHD